MGCSPGDKPLILMRCQSYMKTLKGGISSVAEPTTFKGDKWENFLFFLSSQALFLFYCSSFHGVMRANLAWTGGGNV